MQCHWYRWSRSILGQPLPSPWPTSQLADLDSHSSDQRTLELVNQNTFHLRGQKLTLLTKHRRANTLPCARRIFPGYNPMNSNSLRHISTTFPLLPSLHLSVHEKEKGKLTLSHNATLPTSHFHLT